MKTLKILSVAEKFFKTITILTVIVLLFSIGMFIHSIFFPNVYDKVLLNMHNGYGIEYKETAPEPPRSYAEYKEGTNKNIYYSRLTIGSKAIILLVQIIELGLILLIFQNVINFFKSVKNYSTFFVNNSKYFKKMGYYFSGKLLFDLVFIFISRDVTMMFPDGCVRSLNTNISIRIDLLGYSCIFLILCFVASQVFKEGEHLRIEHELTI